LIDTHVVVWMATGDRRLSRTVADLLQSGDAEILVSVVSEWELALKRRKPDFRLPVPFETIVRRAAFKSIGLDPGTPRALGDLPDIHKDPFDRILVAQALIGGHILVSRDKAVRRYPVPTLW
jgi:PIN domain nuclease of toxin-antitoxin system